MTHQTYRIGIDIGGTFTDFAMLKAGPTAETVETAKTTEEVVLYKNLTTPDDRSQGVMAGLAVLAEGEGLALDIFLSRCETIVHGTTVADNTLIEMNGAVTGLITTEGFRDELEYRRGYKEDIWDVRLAPPPRIVPRRRRLTVPERIVFNGSIHRPLDDAAVRAACRRLAAQGVESVAVVLIFAHVNPVHEQRVADIIMEEMPGVSLSLGHRVLPRAPEYDRTSTTVVNAYVAPRVNAYLERLVSRLAQAGYPRQLMVMQASGGVMTRAYIAAAPVRVLASGPAGGVIGSAHVGVAKGWRNLLCIDMGGTSYDMSVVTDAAAPAVAGWNMHHRYLVGVPMIQVETLGAGGGSICYVEAGELKVGPASAGALPGPICYGRGGTRPTVTDALLLLGILATEEDFAGGNFRLCEDGVREAFGALGAELGCGPEQAAFDCWRVVNATMSQAVRRTTAAKGLDPAGMVMLAYGGNGPAFAAIQAEDLGIERVVVPRTSPAFSALGALIADPSVDEERSCVVRADALDLPLLRALATGLAEGARASFADAGFAGDDVMAHWRLGMRYRGQNWALSFDVYVARGLDDISFLDDGLGERAIALFNQRHQAEYGHIREDEVPEMTSLRLVASVATPVPPAGGGFTAPEFHPDPKLCRQANLGHGFMMVDVFAGADMRPGAWVAGPAIIAESFTTIIVYPGWNARVDDAGDYLMERCG